MGLKDIHTAAMNGESEKLQQYIHTKCDVNEQDTNGVRDKKENNESIGDGEIDFDDLKTFIFYVSGYVSFCSQRVAIKIWQID